jgi:hypothetical protein
MVRRATAADARALTRLREVMLSDMGMLVTGAGPGCRDKAEAGSDIGVCDQHAPGPGNPGGVRGLVFNMSTEPRTAVAATPGPAWTPAGLVPR